MEKKLNSLHTRKKERKSKDPCPVCEDELYYSRNFSKRVGLFDLMSQSHHVIGWACPHCHSEFDKKDNIMYIYGQDYMQGDS